MSATPRTDALFAKYPPKVDVTAMIDLCGQLERELAAAKAELKRWDESYARWCVLMVKRGVHTFGFLDDAINALYDRATAAEQVLQAIVNSVPFSHMHLSTKERALEVLRKATVAA